MVLGAMNSATVQRSRRSAFARCGVARRLLRRRGARCGDGCALCALRASPAISPSTSAAMSATASAASAGSARAWWRWSRSRCARARSAPSMPAISERDAGRGRACGAQPGKLTLRINSANPTVSTASADFIRAADGAGGWEGQVWDQTIEVPCTTLDALVAEHGAAGLRQDRRGGLRGHACWPGFRRPLPALSFEFTTIQRDVAHRCLDRLDCARGLRLRYRAGREPGADLRALDLQGRHGRPHRRPAARRPTPGMFTVFCRS